MTWKAKATAVKDFGTSLIIKVFPKGKRAVILFYAFSLWSYFFSDDKLTKDLSIGFIWVFTAFLFILLTLDNLLIRKFNHKDKWKNKFWPSSITLHINPRAFGYAYTAIILAFSCFFNYLSIMSTDHFGSDPDVFQQNSWVDSFYFSIITITTLGYGDITPNSDTARIFCSIQSFLGVLIMGIFLYSLSINRENQQQKLKRIDFLKERNSFYEKAEGFLANTIFNIREVFHNTPAPNMDETPTLKDLQELLDNLHPLFEESLNIDPEHSFTPFRGLKLYVGLHHTTPNLKNLPTPSNLSFTEKNSFKELIDDCERLIFVTKKYESLELPKRSTHYNDYLISLPICTHIVDYALYLRSNIEENEKVLGDLYFG